MELEPDSELSNWHGEVACDSVIQVEFEIFVESIYFMESVCE